MFDPARVTTKTLRNGAMTRPEIGLLSPIQLQPILSAVRPHGSPAKDCNAAGSHRSRGSDSAQLQSGMGELVKNHRDIRVKDLSSIRHNRHKSFTIVTLI